MTSAETAAARASDVGFPAEPDADGWYVRAPGDTGTFIESYGTIRVRREGERLARIRLDTGRAQANSKYTAHGGYLLSVVDMAIIAGPTVCGLSAFGGSTVDVSAQFLAPVTLDRQIDVVVEVLKETGRMFFVRGLIEQDGAPALSFSGTVRKPR